MTEEVGEIRDVLLKPTMFQDPKQALLEIAYEEIKDRNGKMVNGTYVKSEDL